ASTPGMVGADLANLVNEAALLAARRGHELVNAADFGDAFERLLLGAERNIVLSLVDRERTAYHEAGHAIVGMMSPEADPVMAVDSRGTFLPGAAAPSEQTQQLVDQEVRRIVDEAYDEVVALLREHRSKLDDLALALLDRETLDGPDAYAAAGIEPVLADEDLRDTTPAPA